MKQGKDLIRRKGREGKEWKGISKVMYSNVSNVMGL
jgi:hypothetical protein